MSKNTTFLYSLQLVIIIFLGLLTRSNPEFFPDFIAQYGGDTLWSLALFTLISLTLRKASLKTRIMLALTLSYIVEISQLYQAPWLNELRSYKLVGLILGYGFLWSDFLCYTAGILIGGIIDKIFYKRL